MDATGGRADKTMLASQFNHFADRPDGTVLFFNALSGALGTIPKETYDLLTAADIDISSLSLETKRSLLESGLLTEVDELNSIQRSFNKDKSSKGSLGFTIAPTIACNFACSYCYQDHSNSKVMSDDVQDRLLAMLNSLGRSGLKKLSVTWFGGEPLLAHKVISRLMPRLRKTCDENGIAFVGSSMVSNGTLLSRERALELSTLGVKNVQISFDSLDYLVPHKRGVRMEDGSPSPILMNCLINRDILDFSIRVNVGKDLDPELPELLSYLQKFGLKDLVYMTRIHNEGSGLAWAETPTDHTISVIRFAKRREDLVVKDADYLKKGLQSLTRRNHFCGATRLTSVAFDAAGYAYRCWHSIGKPAESIFSLESVKWDTDPWAEYSPLQYDECRTCKVLPLCMGGCAHGRVSGLNAKPPCEPIKFEIGPLLSFMAKQVNLEQ